MGYMAMELGFKTDIIEPSAIEFLFMPKVPRSASPIPCQERMQPERSLLPLTT
jgi:hypothetical protein